MTKIDQRYLDGIKEGRTLLNWWMRDKIPLREMLTDNIECLERLCAKLADSAYEVPFLKGELDFYRNQLRNL